MIAKIKLACEPEIKLIEVAKILPSRILTAATRHSSKYKRIATSIRELGLVEPLIVHPQKGTHGMYLLLDGHARLEILKSQGIEFAKCLIAADDEAFTYNHKVNQLSAIQEHFMILKAIRSGVTEERIATVLAVNVASIRAKRDLLDGICPEAVRLLKDRRAAGGAIREMRKVKPIRQIEMAELMCASHNFSAAYAKCLVAATPDEQLVNGSRAKDVHGFTAEEMARMEHEMESISRDFKLIEESHGRNVLNLVIVVGYLRKLLDNARVVRYLSQSHPEILAEFQKVVDSRKLADGSGSDD
jgi:ParB-like chromosome segregation protein Spo0J